MDQFLLDPHILTGQINFVRSTSLLFSAAASDTWATMSLVKCHVRRTTGLAPYRYFGPVTR